MKIFPAQHSQSGMSLVGVIVTIAIISIGTYALMSTQGQFSKTARTVETKESVIQELTNRAAILQTLDFLKLEETCATYAMNGSTPGDCHNQASTSSHSFLYRWYSVDALTRLCFELTRCDKLANGKMYSVFLTAHHISNGKQETYTFTFRKAK